MPTVAEVNEHPCPECKMPSGSLCVGPDIPEGKVGVHESRISRWQVVTEAIAYNEQLLAEKAALSAPARGLLPGHIGFRDGIQLPYEPPKNTLDPRWAACTEHRPACDCREAERAEEISELHAEWNGFRAALKDVLTGHASCCCRCTGCEIARRLHLSFVGSGDHCND
jgi:hypothetical protein